MCATRIISLEPESLPSNVLTESKANNSNSKEIKMPPLKVISLDTNSYHVSPSTSPKKNVTLCDSVTCVIEQFNQSLVVNDQNDIVIDTMPSAAAKSSSKTTSTPTHRRERNRALTSQDFDALILSQMESEILLHNL